MHRCSTWSVKAIDTSCCSLLKRRKTKVIDEKMERERESANILKLEIKMMI